MKERKRPTIEEIQREFESKSSHLITSTYINNAQDLEFICTKCGKPYHIRWSNYMMGRNPHLLCEYCKPHGKKDINEIRKQFEAKGAKLLTKEYKNNRDPLIFSCSNCGNIYQVSWSNFMRGRNSTLLCKDCLKQKKHLLFEKYVKIYDAILNRRGEIGKYFLLHALEFWNIKKGYVAHHVRSFAEYPDLATSLSNIYPLKPYIHLHSFVDPKIKIQNPFHSIHPRKLKDTDWFSTVEKYPDYVKLSYHNYSDFVFIDLTKYFVTELYISTLPEIHEYLEAKENWYFNQGILYFPIDLEDFKDSSFRKDWLQKIKYRVSTETELGTKIFNYTGGI